MPFIQLIVIIIPHMPRPDWITAVSGNTERPFVIRGIYLSTFYNTVEHPIGGWSANVFKLHAQYTSLAWRFFEKLPEGLLEFSCKRCLRRSTPAECGKWRGNMTETCRWKWVGLEILQYSMTDLVVQLHRLVTVEFNVTQPNEETVILKCIWALKQRTICKLKNFGRSRDQSDESPLFTACS